MAKVIEMQDVNTAQDVKARENQDVNTAQDVKVSENQDVNTAQDMDAAIVPFSAAWLEERVPIKLFWDGKKYKDDVFVAVNGERCQIQRGQEVYIPRKFALALQDSETQDAEAARVAATFERAFESGKNELT